MRRWERPQPRSGRPRFVLLRIKNHRMPTRMSLRSIRPETARALMVQVSRAGSGDSTPIHWWHLVRSSRYLSNPP
ncbi:unnamed protein product [Nezara viridula]|uniref:Uncharacterized protein n=1 Tax=Nezara viridula TaxID=85310 RepID=A0A9P0HDV6_NEZVI|nr:unnamed protein product [Nezara viridula]